MRIWTSGAKDLIGKTQEFSLVKFVEHVFPRSVFESMANNEVLQLVDIQYILSVLLHSYR
jgi:Na+/H+-dicarboxylate symporter